MIRHHRTHSCRQDRKLGSSHLHLDQMRTQRNPCLPPRELTNGKQPVKPRSRTSYEALSLGSRAPNNQNHSGTPRPAYFANGLQCSKWMQILGDYHVDSQNGLKLVKSALAINLLRHAHACILIDGTEKIQSQHSNVQLRDIHQNWLGVELLGEHSPSTVTLLWDKQPTHGHTHWQNKEQRAT